MTLREYINMVMSTGSIHKVISCLQTVYYPDIDDPRHYHKIAHSYTTTALELVNLPENIDTTDDLHSIVLTQVIDTDTSTEHMDVHGVDSNGETFAIEWVDWKKLIDLPVYSKKKLDLISIVCHLLYELTFNGYTHAQLMKSIEDLEQDIKDSAQEHNILPFSLDELK